MEFLKWWVIYAALLSCFNSWTVTRKALKWARYDGRDPDAWSMSDTERFGGMNLEHSKAFGDPVILVSIGLGVVTPLGQLLRRWF